VSGVTVSAGGLPGSCPLSEALLLYRSGYFGVLRVQYFQQREISRMSDEKFKGLTGLPSIPNIYDVGRYQMPDFSKIKPRDIAQETGEWVAIMLRKTVAQQGHNLVTVIQDQVKQLEATLQEGESLIVYCDAGQERIRAQTFTFPNWHLAIVAGLDEQGHRTCRIENFQDMKLTCKIVKSAVKSPEIGFVLPGKKQAEGERSAV
jgi:hypothetical protein